MTLRCFAVSLATLFFHAAQSQLALPGSTQSEPAIAATSIFLQAFRNEKEIYNGPEHVDYLPTIEGLAYFNANGWQTGSVYYYNMLYRDEALQYDLMKDRLVVRRPDGFAIELRSDKVDWFSLAGHTFIYVGNEKNWGLKPGFYDQLATGAITVLVRRRKSYEDHIEETRAHRLFVDEITYYAVENGKAHVIRNLRSLLALTGRRSGEIQQQLRRAGIKFRENREAALTAAAHYYNQTQP